jgi:hypothetical protein
MLLGSFSVLVGLRDGHYLGVFAIERIGRRTRSRNGAGFSCSLCHLIFLSVVCGRPQSRVNLGWKSESMRSSGSVGSQPYYSKVGRNIVRFPSKVKGVWGLQLLALIFVAERRRDLENGRHRISTRVENPGLLPVKLNCVRRGSRIPEGQSRRRHICGYCSALVNRRITKGNLC